jgi:misacylated tRNA(Ala) deacylase
MEGREAFRAGSTGKRGMARAFYHEHPETLALETEVVDARPGRVLLARSPFYPGGGGQLADRGRLCWSGGAVAVVGLEAGEGGYWHVLEDPAAELAGDLRAEVDPGFRRMMRALHTGTHILNAFVFQRFAGALVTGAQLNADGTARLDFDVPEADNERLRALEGPINEAIRQNFAVRDDYVALAEAYEVPGLIRSKSVTPPPTADGKIRIVEIVGLDRQACGGTHLAATGDSAPVRILKVDNKGRHNRRVKIWLVGI